jgi:hypothetical protein
MVAPDGVVDLAERFYWDTGYTGSRSCGSYLKATPIRGTAASLGCSIDPVMLRAPQPDQAAKEGVAEGYTRSLNSDNHDEDEQRSRDGPGKALSQDFDSCQLQPALKEAGFPMSADPTPASGPTRLCWRWTAPLAFLMGWGRDGAPSRRTRRISIRTGANDEANLACVQNPPGEIGPWLRAGTNCQARRAPRTRARRV